MANRGKRRGENKQKRKGERRTTGKEKSKQRKEKKEMICPQCDGTGKASKHYGCDVCYATGSVEIVHVPSYILLALRQQWQHRTVHEPQLTFNEHFLELMLTATFGSGDDRLD